MAANIITALPPELLGYVFSFLSREQKDISSCRLVCSTFKNLASRYLITRVVFAHRLKTIAKLQEILDHPYYHKYVVELVFDASSYSESISQDWNEYVEECASAPRKLRDAEWIDRKRNDDAQLQSIRQNLRGPHLGPDTEMEDHPLGMQGYYEQVYSLGCHKSFPDYSRLYEAQREMQKERLGEQILREAIERLPNLRHVTLTDYRHLARNGESFDECCRRLFENTLAPQIVCNRTNLYDSLLQTFRAISAATNAKITSFALASHPFADVIDHSEIETSHRDPTLINLTCFLDVMNLMTSLVESAAMSLQRLDLPLATGLGPDFIEKNAPSLRLFDTVPNLTHLTVSLYEKHTSEEKRLQNDNAFEHLLSRVRLPHLRVLSLRSWYLPVTALRSFLSQHSSTLRHLYLLECIVQEKDLRVLSTWVAENLPLDGLQLGYLAPTVETLSTIRTTRSVTSTSRSIAVQTDPLVVTLGPELEPAWLAGRRNFIERETLRRPLKDEKRSRWWSKPCVW